MASLEVVINSKVYQIGCDEKEKDYVKSMANDLNNRINKLKQKDPEFFSKLNDEKVFLYQLLLMCSEINDLKKNKKFNKPTKPELTELDNYFSATDISKLNNSISNIKRTINKLDDLIKKA